MVTTLCIKRGISAHLSTIFLGTLLGSLTAGANADEVYQTQQGPIRVNRTSVFVDTANVPRIHDFGPTGGFVDSTTGAARVATVMAGTTNSRNVLLSGANIRDTGIPGNIEWTRTSVNMANRAGDGASGEACRVQAASYPVAPDIALTWKLQFQLGESIPGREWTLLPHGRDPALLWQVKAPALQPSLAMVVDTDSRDPTRLMLYFSILSGTKSKIERAGEIYGLLPATPIDVQIKAVLDERSLADGGFGRWTVWVNQNLVLDRVGPTLTAAATEPHQWFFGMYRYLTNCPAVVSRYSRWQMVRLEQGPQREGPTQ